MKTPFPWFGGKSRAAELIWSRFGDCKNYVEPFAGSLAVLLARPHWPFEATRTETVNDIDCYVANFWRAIERDPDAVARHADNPVNEADLHARHTWLHGQAERMECLKTDPDYYDARVAGYWCWGLSSWIGDNFCRPKPQHSVPHLVRGNGVNRKLPHLGDAGKGVNRQLPHLGNAGKGTRRARHEALLSYFWQLADRLRGVRVCCGDWQRVLTPSVTFMHGTTGILLDPPYDIKGCTGYGGDHTGVSSQVREWAIANGNNPLLRIALCGYVDEGHELPDGWRCEKWKAGGGYANQGDARNCDRERIWFSPHCIHPDAPAVRDDMTADLFEAAEPR